jgi:hypothetical protein
MPAIAGRPARFSARPSKSGRRGFSLTRRARRHLLQFLFGVLLLGMLLAMVMATHAMVL